MIAADHELRRLRRMYGITDIDFIKILKFGAEIDIVTNLDKAKDALIIIFKTADKSRGRQIGYVKNSKAGNAGSHIQIVALAIGGIKRA